jgi:hypothetical protein
MATKSKLLTVRSAGRVIDLDAIVEGLKLG